MTRIFSDGFEMGDALSWDEVTSSDADGILPPGAYPFYASSYIGYIMYEGWFRKVIDPISEVYIRSKWTGGSHSTTPRFKINAYKGTTLLISVRQNTAYGPMDIYVGSTKVASGTIPVAASGGAWYLVEVRIKLDNVDGVVQVKVNGVLDTQYFGDTMPDANTTLDKIGFENTSYASRAGIDDIAINDTSGSEDNSWCGDGHILRMAPNASGSSSMFIGNDGDSVDNYLLVDERPQDGDTTFVLGENIGDYDLYNFAASNLPSEQVIKMVWVEGTAKDPEAGNVSMLVQSGSTLSEDDADQALSSAYGRVKSDIYTTDPNTGEAWTEDALDAIQAGMKVKS